MSIIICLVCLNDVSVDAMFLVRATSLYGSVFVGCKLAFLGK